MTALHLGAAVEHVAYGARERLAPVEHEQRPTVGREPTIAQILEQLAATARVLCRAFAHAHYVLRALDVDPERDQEHVVVDVDAVDEHRDDSIPSRGHASHAPMVFEVASTNLRLTALLLVPRSRTSGPSGSRDPRYLRVETPRSICCTGRS